MLPLLLLSKSILHPLKGLVEQKLAPLTYFIQLKLNYTIDVFPCLFYITF